MSDFNVVEFQGVRKSYDGKVVVRDFSNVQKQNVKSLYFSDDEQVLDLFIKLLVGQAVPDQGKVFVAGVQPDTNPIISRNFCGFLLPIERFNSELTVSHYLKHRCGFFDFGKPEANQRQMDVIQEFSLEEVADVPVLKLQLLQKLKLQAAVSFLHFPKILVTYNFFNQMNQASVLGRKEFGKLIESIYENLKKYNMGWICLEKIMNMKIDLFNQIVLFNRGNYIIRENNEELQGKFSAQLALKIGVPQGRRQFVFTKLNQDKIRYISHEEDVTVYGKSSQELLKIAAELGAERFDLMDYSILDYFGEENFNG